MCYVMYITRLQEWNLSPDMELEPYLKVAGILPLSVCLILQLSTFCITGTEPLRRQSFKRWSVRDKASSDTKDSREDGLTNEVPGSEVRPTLDLGNNGRFTAYADAGDGVGDGVEGHLAA